MYFAHHGIKGQKWGVRRYQNSDGTLTKEGKARREQYMKFIRDEYAKNNSDYTMRKISRKFFDSDLGKDFINDEEVSNLYRERNKKYDNFDDFYEDSDEFKSLSRDKNGNATDPKTGIAVYGGIEQGYVAGTKFEKGIREQVKNLLLDYANTTITRVGASGKEYKTTAEDFVMKLIEEADNPDYRNPAHKYYHERAWQHWS